MRGCNDGGLIVCEVIEPKVFVSVHTPEMYDDDIMENLAKALHDVHFCIHEQLHRTEEKK